MQRLPTIIATISLAAALVATAAAAAGVAWKPVEVLRVFEGENADFDSRVYRQGAFFLAVPSAGEHAYLLDKKNELVYRVPRSDQGFGDGTPSVAVDALGGYEQLGGYEKQNRGRSLVWETGGAVMAVGPKPEFIGLFSRDQVLAEKPDYRKEAEAYEPQSAAVERIATNGDSVDFVVAFGTWCPICAEWTPRLIEVLDGARIPSERLVFVSVDPEITEPAEDLERLAIEGVPTFIVRRDGEEIGRVELADLDRDPTTPIELRIAGILDGGGS